MSLDLSAPHAPPLYTDGAYLAATGGTWPLDDAPFTAKYVDLLVRRNGLEPATVCEIGCGAGGVLAQLRQSRPAAELTGYDISPQAHALSRRFAGDRLKFVLGDALALPERYDLALVMDVVEHVEDCFGFLRGVREKGAWQIYHLPLEINASTALRDMLAEGYRLGHIHHFSLSTARAALRYTGHDGVDSGLTPVALECGKLGRTQVANLVRRCLPAPLCTRLLGGYSLMALCRRS